MFFERVKELCTANNIKISNLLKELGMSPGNLTRLKNGTVPDGNTLIAIAKYFDVSTDYLLGIDDIKKRLLDMLDDANKPDALTQRLVTYFQQCDEDGKLRIIQFAMNEFDRSESERKKAQAGASIPSAG